MAARPLESGAVPQRAPTFWGGPVRSTLVVYGAPKTVVSSTRWRINLHLSLASGSKFMWSYVDRLPRRLVLFYPSVLRRERISRTGRYVSVYLCVRPNVEHKQVSKQAAAVAAAEPNCRTVPPETVVLQFSIVSFSCSPVQAFYASLPSFVWVRFPGPFCAHAARYTCRSYGSKRPCPVCVCVCVCVSVYPTWWWSFSFPSLPYLFAYQAVDQ